MQINSRQRPTRHPAYGNGHSLTVTYNDACQVKGLTKSLGEQIAIKPNAVSGAWETLAIQNQQGEDVLFKQRSSMSSAASSR